MTYSCETAFTPELNVQAALSAIITGDNQTNHDAARTRLGLPRRSPHDRQVLAAAYAAQGTAKNWLTAVLLAAGRLPHIAGGKDVSDGASRLLYRLTALLHKQGCTTGNFQVTVCNKTLAHEMNRDVRSIRRYLAELQDAGWIYRHFTTGSLGIQRPAIDLGPTATRLSELEGAISARAEARAEIRAMRAECETLNNKETNLSWGEDKPVPLNTDDSESICNVIAKERDSLVSDCGKASQSVDIKGIYENKRPEFIPKIGLVLEQCPSLALYVDQRSARWPDLVDAASKLAEKWDLNEIIWGRLCLALGREWAAITVGTVAELPETWFTRSRGQTIGSKRASYVSGIAKKLATNQVNITASWFRHMTRHS